VNQNYLPLIPKESKSKQPTATPTFGSTALTIPSNHPEQRQGTSRGLLWLKLKPPFILALEGQGIQAANV